MGLQSDAMTYIKFFIFLLPVVIPSMAVIGSFYEGNLKGLFYILGLIITMTFGGMISKTAGRLVPHIGKIGGKGKAGTPDGPFTPLINAACNLVGAGDSESWGLMYSLPGPHALMLAYTVAYLIFPIFIHNNFNVKNLFLIGGLLLVSVLSALFRTSSTMQCVSMVDVSAGWATGLMLGGVWYFIVSSLAASSNMKDVVYFSNNESDMQKCRLEKKAFRCKSKKKI